MIKTLVHLLLRHFKALVDLIKTLVHLLLRHFKALVHLNLHRFKALIDRIEVLFHYCKPFAGQLNMAGQGFFFANEALVGKFKALVHAIKAFADSL